MESGLARLLEVMERHQDSNVGFSIRSAEWTDNDLRLTGNVIAHGACAETWEFLCREVLGFTSGLPYWSDVTVVEDREHPLLRQYIDDGLPLFFAGRTANISALIGDLWLAHREACADWIPFAGFAPTTFEVGFGMLTAGPRFVIDAYTAVLARYNLGPHTLEPRGPRREPVEAVGLLVDSVRVVAATIAAREILPS